MNSKKFSEAMSELDSKYVDEALNYKKKAQKPVWVKWGAVAACFAVVTVLGIGAFQSGLFGSKTDIATLDNGNEIVFVKSETAGSSIDIDGTITTRQLTEDEITTLFPNLPVTAHAIFRTSDMDGGNSGGNSPKLIGFEGNIGNIKMVVSTSEVQLLDTVIVGTEENTEINGITIAAGYFVTDPNSKGEQNAIYYATFEIDGCIVYLENAGTKAYSETTKKQLAEVIQKLIENGELDITPYLDSETGTDIDGNPDGYGPLPNSQTSDEEVSEQDHSISEITPTLFVQQEIIEEIKETLIAKTYKAGRKCLTQL